MKFLKPFTQKVVIFMIHVIFQSLGSFIVIIDVPHPSTQRFTMFHPSTPKAQGWRNWGPFGGTIHSAFCALDSAEMMRGWWSARSWSACVFVGMVCKVLSIFVLNMTLGCLVKQSKCPLPNCWPRTKVGAQVLARVTWPSRCIRWSLMSNFQPPNFFQKPYGPMRGLGSKDTTYQ